MEKNRNELDDSYEAQKLNEFYNWQPVSNIKDEDEERDKAFEKHIAKLMAMKKFNSGR